MIDLREIHSYDDLSRIGCVELVVHFILQLANSLTENTENKFKNKYILWTFLSLCMCVNKIVSR